MCVFFLLVWGDRRWHAVVVVLHVSKILQRLVQHDDVGVLLLEAGRFVLALVVPPLAKVLLHHVRLAAQLFVLSLGFFF